MKYAFLILMAFAFVSCEEDEETAISISGQVVDGETQLAMADITKQVDYYDVLPILPAPATGGFQKCIITKNIAADGNEDVLITVWCNEI